MRLTVTVKQNPTLFAKLKAKTARQKVAAREATAKSAERAFVRVQELVPRDTNYMADHTRIRLTDEGLGYLIGWYTKDFVGQTNPVTGQQISTFYPRYVVYGTSQMAGRDPLTPALQAERPNYRRAIARALSG